MWSTVPSDVTSSQGGHGDQSNVSSFACPSSPSEGPSGILLLLLLSDDDATAIVVGDDVTTMEDHNPVAAAAAVDIDAVVDIQHRRQEEKRERQNQRRRSLADRARLGDRVPAGPTTAKARRLFLAAGPDYEWDGAQLVMTFGPASKRTSVTLNSGAVTERGLRRLSRAAAHSPEKIHDLVVSGEAAHAFEAIEMVAAACVDTAAIPEGFIDDTVAVRNAGGRLGPKRPEDPREE